MKRTPIMMAAVLALAVPAAGLAGTSPTVHLEKTARGKLLANRHGLTIFVFSKDGKNKDTCVKKPGCTMIWPPLTTTAKPTGGPGIKASLLGTIKLPSGKKQVTYNHHPLYTFNGDSPGDTSYIGVSAQGGVWYALNAAGKLVK